MHPVLTGNERRTAICRGAVYKGFQDDANAASYDDGGLEKMRLPIHVASTISRASYGHDYYEPFIRGLHLEKDKHWNSLEKKWVAKKQVQWYLTRVSASNLSSG